MLGTNTDPYQRAEGRYRLMPDIITSLTAVRHAVLDPDEGHAAAARPSAADGCRAAVHVTLAMSIAVFDEELQKTIEPGTPTAQARLDTVRAAAEAGFAVTVFLMPILPHLTDSIAALDDALRRIKAAGATRVVFGALHLRPGVKPWFMQWLAREHPELVSSYLGLYPGASVEAPKAYRSWLVKRVRPLLRAHRLDGRTEEDTPRGVPVVGPRRPFARGHDEPWGRRARRSGGSDAVLSDAPGPVRVGSWCASTPTAHNVSTRRRRQEVGDGADHGHGHAVHRPCRADARRRRRGRCSRARCAVLHRAPRSAGGSRAQACGSFPGAQPRTSMRTTSSRPFPRLKGRRGIRQLVVNIEDLFIRSAVGQASDLRDEWAREPWDVLVAEESSVGPILVSGVDRSAVGDDRHPAPAAAEPPPSAGRPRVRARPAARSAARGTRRCAVSCDRCSSARCRRPSWSAGAGGRPRPGRAGVRGRVAVPDADRRNSGCARLDFNGPTLRRSCTTSASWRAGASRRRLPTARRGGATSPGARTVVLTSRRGRRTSIRATSSGRRSRRWRATEALVIATTGVRGRSELPFPVPANARVTDFLPP